MHDGTTMPVLKINKPYTIHTSRTIMYQELSDLIALGTHEERIIIAENVLRKASRSNLEKTLGFLSRIYDFKIQNELWKVFTYLWPFAEEKDKRLLTLLYALKKDDLVRYSLKIVLDTPVGERLNLDSLKKALEEQYPAKYSQITLHSAAKNLASSWKQAGFIEGKVKRVRVRTKPGYIPVVFATYLAYSFGERGENLLKTLWTRVLELSESEIRKLLSEATIRDILEYKYAGGITTISFEKLLNAIK